jgi:hypothetical protein
MARGEPTKTIAHAKAGGETALTVHCLGFGCYHQAVKTFEELKLWNDVIFVDVPKHRRFVCSQCGGRESGALMVQEGLAVTPYPAPVRCGMRGNILQKTRS